MCPWETSRWFSQASRPVLLLTVSALICLFLFGCGSTQPTIIPSPDQWDGQPVSVNVCGANMLNPTGKTAHPGERWFIEVTGSTAACTDGNYGHPDLHDCDQPKCAEWKDGCQENSPPTGWEKWFLKPVWFLKRVRSARWYELSGGIGSDLRQTFAIGRSRTITVTKDGEIYLFANDAPSRYCNNFGSLRVRLVRLRR